MRGHHLARASGRDRRVGGADLVRGRDEPAARRGRLVAARGRRGPRGDGHEPGHAADRPRRARMAGRDGGPAGRPPPAQRLPELVLYGRGAHPARSPWRRERDCAARWRQRGHPRRAHGRLVVVDRAQRRRGPRARRRRRWWHGPQVVPFRRWRCPPAAAHRARCHRRDAHARAGRDARARWALPRARRRRREARDLRGVRERRASASGDTPGAARRLGIVERVLREPARRRAAHRGGLGERAARTARPHRLPARRWLRAALGRVGGLARLRRRARGAQSGAGAAGPAPRDLAGALLRRHDRPAPRRRTPTGSCDGPTARRGPSTTSGPPTPRWT